LVAVPIALAAKPGKLIEHEVYDGPFNGGWCKSVKHGTIILHGMEGELNDVTIFRLEKIILYTEEKGEIIAILKMNMNYHGTVTTLDGDGPFDTLWTGKIVLDIVLIELIEGMLPDDAPETMHVVMWFEEGIPGKILPPWMSP